MSRMSYKSVGQNESLRRAASGRYGTKQES